MAGKTKNTASALKIGALPPLSGDLLETLPDDALGAWLWMTFIQTQAQDLGIPTTEITEGFCDRFVEHVKTLEVSTAKHAAVEKALHLAAGGDFERSGKLFREYLTGGADALAWKNLGQRYVPAGIRKLEQAREFGKRGAQVKQQQGQENKKAVLEAAEKIIRSRKTSRCPKVREIAPTIAGQTSLSEPTVRRHLTTAELVKLWQNRTE